QWLAHLQGPLEVAQRNLELVFLALGVERTVIVADGSEAVKNADAGEALRPLELDLVILGVGGNEFVPDLQALVEGLLGLVPSAILSVQDAEVVAGGGQITQGLHLAGM